MPPRTVADKLVPFVAVNRVGVAVNVADKAEGTVVCAVAKKPEVSSKKTQKKQAFTETGEWAEVDINMINRVIIMPIYTRRWKQRLSIYYIA